MPAIRTRHCSNHGSCGVPFRWLVVRAEDHLEIAAGEAPIGLLSAAEMRVLEKLRFERRRRKWLLGRLATKLLLQNVEMQRTGRQPDACSLVVQNEPSGAPYAVLSDGIRLPYPISISHRTHWGVASVGLPPTKSVGIDLETIEPRGIAWCEDYFVAHEMQFVREAGAEQDLMVAGIWSAKESMLKALGLGLRRDLRTIEVHPPASAGLETRVVATDWNPIHVRMLEDRSRNTVRAFWKDCGDYVLTSVAMT